MKISTPVSRILMTGAVAAFLIVPSFAQAGAKPGKAAPAPAPAAAATVKVAPTKSTKGKSATHKMSAHHAAHKSSKSTKMAPAKKS